MACTTHATPPVGTLTRLNNEPKMITDYVRDVGGRYRPRSVLVLCLGKTFRQTYRAGGVMKNTLSEESWCSFSEVSATSVSSVSVWVIFYVRIKLPQSHRGTQRNSVTLSLGFCRRWRWRWTRRRVTFWQTGKRNARVNSILHISIDLDRHSLHVASKVLIR